MVQRTIYLQSLLRVASATVVKIIYCVAYCFFFSRGAGRKLALLVNFMYLFNFHYVVENELLYYDFHEEFFILVEQIA